MNVWVEDEIKAGGFATASEYFRHLVREAKAHKELEKQLIAGVESGEAQFATPQWWDDLHAELAGESVAES